MSRRARVAGVVAFFLIAIAGYWMSRRGGGRDEAVVDPAGSGSPAAGRVVDRTAGTASPDGMAQRPRRPAHSVAQRQALLAAVEAARVRRTTGATATPPAAGSGGTAGTAGTPLDIADKTGDTSPWEKRTLATLNNLLGECYALGRAEDPGLEGTVMLQFTIAGEPKVGGLLEHVELDDEHTSIQQATLRECMTESLYALELDPPPAGIRVERQLSLRFP